ncbi:hypothetical protein EV643_102417 [Kribbella sp. VKM Ac-2527]|uniref:Uncharacterized protein n=1 Tax=Kribbella caucasensis TaxID=2512215 RepID=A0A4R6KLY8_9ACTN|nr:hypothetical protein [Kribbella sp. VKM Ac-2527]TDO52578.1 hypothetical protein EV643_102417 [Kribbella sp. VKM Ac-2527]
MLTHSLAMLGLLGSLGATPPAPVDIFAGGVRLAWADTTYENIRITWTEATPAPNTITFERPGLPDRQLRIIPADAPNEVLIDRWSLVPNGDPAAVGRIVVSEPMGDEARSADFDRYIRSTPSPSLAFTADGGLRWTVPPEPGTDTTPNDPLDVDQPLRYVPELLLDELPHTVMDCGQIRLPATTIPSGVIANRNKPYSMILRTVNEWNPGGQYNPGAEVATTSITLTAPASTPYGATTTLTGTVSSRWIYQSGRPPACQEVDGWQGGGDQVILQARNSSAGPWYVVGLTKTIEGGKYTFAVRNPGAREYRTVVPASIGGNSARYGSTSTVKLVKSTTRVVSAKFIQPVIPYGTKPQAYLWVDPAGSQRAALQFKNASGAWQGLTWKSLYAGRGLIAFNWYRRGATQFRWWVPGSTTSTGLKVDPVYSGTFSVTIR